MSDAYREKKAMGAAVPQQSVDSILADLIVRPSTKAFNSREFHRLLQKIRSESAVRLSDTLEELRADHIN